jgi:hypothetical protein
MTEKSCNTKGSELLPYAFTSLCARAHHRNLPSLAKERNPSRVARFWIFARRIDFVGSDSNKYPPRENALKIGKWICKTKIVIISSKNQFRPQFWAQIVAGVETHRYKPFFRSWRLFFGKVMRGTSFRNFAIRSTIRFLKTAKSTFVLDNLVSPRQQYIWYRTVRLGAPYKFWICIVKSAMRLINSGKLHIKKQYAVWVYAKCIYNYIFRTPTTK